MKVLIVEDEYLVRVGLRSSIDWNGNGFTLLDDATNGEEALDRIEKEHPNIVLLDIRIPKLDGIELLKIIKERRYDCKVVIISCHDDFSLVREAMRLGAVDYLRKLSIKPSEILEVLTALKKSSDIPDSGSSNDGSQDSQLLDEQLMKMIAGTGENQASSSKLDAGYSLYIDVDYPFEHFNTIKTNVFINLVRQIIKSLGKDCCICTSEESAFYVAILDSKSDVSAAEKIKGQLLSTTGISVSIGMGPVWTRRTDIKQSFESAKNISYDKFYQGCGLVQNYTSGVYERIAFSSGLSKAERNISALMELKKYPDIIKSLTDIFDDIRAKHCYYPDAIKAESIEAFNSITRQLPHDTSFESKKLNIFRSIMAMQTLDELESYFIEQINLSIDHIDPNRTKVSSSIVKNALNYITDNIYKDISLSQLARAVNVSESYLSMLFHKEIGENCIAFINKQKIKIAKLMLKENSLVYEVAERLSFESSSYFSKVFKKYVGVTPEQYRSKTPE